MKQERDREEMQWLANGSPSELERIKNFTTAEYLDLLKYKVDKIEKNG